MILTDSNISKVKSLKTLNSYLKEQILVCVLRNDIFAITIRP